MNMRQRRHALRGAGTDQSNQRVSKGDAPTDSCFARTATATIGRAWIVNSRLHANRHEECKNERNQRAERN